MAAVHLGLGFNYRDIRQFRRQSVQNTRSEILAAKFSSSESNGYFDLVPLIDEFPRIALLEIIVVGINHRTHPDFLDCESRLLLSGLSLFFAFFEFVLR